MAFSGANGSILLSAANSLRPVLLVALVCLSCLSFYRIGLNEGSLHSRLERPTATTASSAAIATALRGSPATLHGRVTKAGPLDEKTWHPRFTDYINNNFSKWIGHQQMNGIGELSPAVFPGCAVWANHEYKFIFLRHPKCATTSILKHFTLCTEPQAKATCLEQWSGHDGTLDRTKTSADIRRIWDEYFVFTVVRNPLSRAVSSYKFLVSATLAKPECSNLMDWDMFCADPVVAGQICRWKRKCCPFGAIFAFAHIPDQARCMQTQDGGLAVDFVARMEHLQEDMAYVYAEINRRRPAGLPPLRFPAAMAVENTAKPCDTSQKLSAEHGRMFPSPFFGVVYNFSTQIARESVYCSMQQFYQGRHAHCLPSIAHAYARDLALLYPDKPGF